MSMAFGKLQELTTEQTDSWNAMQPVHGGLLLAFLAIPHFVHGLQRWPWYLLAPLSAYLLMVALVAPLRRTVRWNRLGRLRASVAVATAVLIVTSSSVLMVYD